MTSEDSNNPEEEELWFVLLKTLSGRMKNLFFALIEGVLLSRFFYLTLNQFYLAFYIDLLINKCY